MVYKIQFFDILIKKKKTFHVLSEEIVLNMHKCVFSTKICFFLYIFLFIKCHNYLKMEYLTQFSVGFFNSAIKFTKKKELREILEKIFILGKCFIIIEQKCPKLERNLKAQKCKNILEPYSYLSSMLKDTKNGKAK